MRASRRSYAKPYVDLCGCSLRIFLCMLFVMIMDLVISNFVLLSAGHVHDPNCYAMGGVCGHAGKLLLLLLLLLIVF